ncbi:MAG: hypothetical protein M3680_36210 [Myxococcota bacterium]|nr:hypothetical protein [Myxococcota bacterium]
MRATCLRLVLIVLAACGGSYQTAERATGAVDRGETNGRTFEFVSNTPEGDDWQVRIRDSSMWASYSEGEDSKELKPVNLDKRETRKLWDLIDFLELHDRKKGKQDEDEGYVVLRLREPGGDEGHDLITVYVSRATEDQSVLDVGGYLQILIKKYHRTDAEF